ncbi:expressed unknown protein [Seminavis robusta]|uniref:Uncharacterized protein n=1 Tax=Seminavis robusta TaxID=568900 RepID=A0A9N8DHI6_9STRA|nr:expressed unknown protein [Seminavis robusta]|eukprot:Sro88_g046500.1 n/a (240) ;mRNA; r:64574-65293
MSSSQHHHNLQETKQHEWPLDVFRHTSGRGWEKLVPADSIHTHTTGPNAVGVPNEGHVTIQRFRLKISVMDSEGKVLSEVIRRNDALLFVSSNRLRAILLKFKTIQDCEQFSSRLMELNPIAPETATTSSDQPMDWGTTVSSEGMHSSNADMEIDQQLQRNELLSYIVRLQQEESFNSFTNKIEQLVEESGLWMMQEDPYDQSSMEVVNDATDSATSSAGFSSGSEPAVDETMATGTGT